MAGGVELILTNIMIIVFDLLLILLAIINIVLQKYQLLIYRLYADI